MEENNSVSESFDRAMADIQMMRSAYPDETAQPETTTSSDCHHHRREFPLHVTLRFSETSYIQLELTEGYPTETNVLIASYRSSPDEKRRMENAVSAVRQTANECLEDGIEGGLACCAAALEAWNESDTYQKFEEEEARGSNDVELNNKPAPTTSDDSAAASCSSKTYHWISGSPLVDRKSTFVAHACRISSEVEAREAIRQLIENNPRLQKATHNMYAYRVTERIITSSDSSEVVSVLKHDNDDDGEDAAGSRLAHLLEMRHEDGIVIVVSRWFGGIHLGPKRFAHINNVARELLVECHDRGAWNA